VLRPSRPAFRPCPRGLGWYQEPSDSVTLCRVLSAIGLTLDLIGAAVLLTGLFRRPAKLFPGFARTPYEAAQDRAYGVAGFLFLGGGFLGQALPSFGVGENHSAFCARVAALATLAIGANVAWILYEVLVRLFFEQQQRYVRDVLKTRYDDTLSWVPRWRDAGRLRVAPGLWKPRSEIDQERRDSAEQEG
jgi:hypothetical protein